MVFVMDDLGPTLIFGSTPNDLYYPEVLVSDNYYKRQWRLSSVRRLRNVICFLEWATWFFEELGRTGEERFWEKGLKFTPEIERMDTKNDAIFKGSRYRLSKAHHFGALQPFVFGGVGLVWGETEPLIIALSHSHLNHIHSDVSVYIYT